MRKPDKASEVGRNFKSSYAPSYVSFVEAASPDSKHHGQKESFGTLTVLIGRFETVYLEYKSMTRGIARRWEIGTPFSSAEEKAYNAIYDKLMNALSETKSQIKNAKSQHGSIKDFDVLMTRIEKTEDGVPHSLDEMNWFHNACMEIMQEHNDLRLECSNAFCGIYPAKMEKSRYLQELQRNINDMNKKLNILYDKEEMFHFAGIDYLVKKEAAFLTSAMQELKRFSEKVKASLQNA
ncbi:MAG: hypothetical protein LBI19_11090 [Oscillospiraceae bacterium]|jgi:predicted RNase H-like nuclease (RuvC/YqgF family)|nr:hypothetical protein [Oscillospiraceae bacterium]